MTTGDCKRDDSTCARPGAMIALAVTCAAMYLPVFIVLGLCSVDWRIHRILQANWIVVPGFIAGSVFDQLIEGPSGVFMGLLTVMCVVIGGVVGRCSYAQLALSSVLILSLSALSVVVAVRLL